MIGKAISRELSLLASRQPQEHSAPPPRRLVDNPVGVQEDWEGMPQWICLPDRRVVRVVRVQMYWREQIGILGRKGERDVWQVVTDGAGALELHCVRTPFEAEQSSISGEWRLYQHLD